MKQRIVVDVGLFRGCRLHERRGLKAAHVWKGLRLARRDRLQLRRLRAANVGSKFRLQCLVR